MIEVKAIKLTIEQIKQLVNMLENANFKGSNAWQIVDLLFSLREGLKDEPIDNQDRNRSSGNRQSKSD